MQLFPRLRHFEAKPLIDRLVAAPLAELEAESELLPRGLVWAPTGGTRVGAGELEELRRALRQAAILAGYQYGSAEFAATREDRLRMDRTLSRVVFEGVRVTPNEAAHGEMWRYVACVLAPELVRWRFAGEESTSAERYGISLRRNMFARLWWRALTFHDPAAADPWAVFDALGEDEMVQVTERPSAAGYGPLARTIARVLLGVHDPEFHPNRSDILRDVMKRLLRRLPLLRYEVLDDGQLTSSVEELFADTFAGLRLQAVPQLRLPFAAAPAATSGPDEESAEDDPTDELPPFDALFRTPPGAGTAAASAEAGAPAPGPVGRPGDDAGALTRALDDQWRAKSDLLQRCDVDERHWMATIKFLVGTGVAEERGERRGARYRARAAGTSPTWVPNLSHPAPAPPPPTTRTATPIPALDGERRAARATPAAIRDPVKEAVLEAFPEIGRQPCPGCQRLMPLFVGRAGPFLRCNECETSIPVAPRALTTVLGQNPGWDCHVCGARLAVRTQGTRNSLTCERGHQTSWPDYRNHLRGVPAPR